MKTATTVHFCGCPVCNGKQFFCGEPATVMLVYKGRTAYRCDAHREVAEEARPGCKIHELREETHARTQSP